MLRSSRAVSVVTVLCSQMSARCVVQILSELPEHLAISVLRASGATLHQCMSQLPPQLQACALQAHCPELTLHNKLHIAGRETARLHSSSDSEKSADDGLEVSGRVCTPVDTIREVCSAASAFTGIVVRLPKENKPY